MFAALTPYAVLGALELAGYVAQWHEVGPPLTGPPLQVVFWTLVWFYALPIAFGVLVRGVSAREALRELKRRALAKGRRAGVDRVHQT